MKRGKKMKKNMYLLTGATGYLGSTVSRLLTAQNKTVRALVMQNDPAISLIPDGVEIVTGDITDSASVNNFFDVSGNANNNTEITVIHCAGMVNATAELSIRLMSVNVGGTRNIINACVNHKVKKLVYISSTSAIPELPHGEVIREADTYDPYLVTGGYSQTKAMATQLVLDAIQEHDLDASVVFSGGISGPGDYGNGHFSRFLIDYINGKIHAGIAGSFNAVDVRDIAEGVIACAEKGRKGEAYIMSGSAVSIHSLFNMISKYSGTKDVNIILPAYIAKISAAFSSLLNAFAGKRGLFNFYAIYNLTRNNVYSSEKAKRELGFRARPLEETVRDTVIWLYGEKRICENDKTAGNINPQLLAA